MTERALSPLQREVLVRASRCGGELDFESFISGSAHDFNRTNFALTQVLRALRRRGLVDADCMLTEAGRNAAALAQPCR